MVVFLVAFAIRYANHEHEPITDELYHILPALSWLQTGALAIADGTYTRASLFTKMVAFALFWGDGDPNAARLLSIFFGSLLVAGVYLWTIRNAGRTAAIVASAMLAVMPGAVFLSQYIRFYSVHALTFWFAAIGIYALATQRFSRTATGAIAIAVAALLQLSFHLQITTLIGIAGLGAWLVVVYMPTFARWFRATSAALKTVTVAVLIAGGMLSLLFVPLEFLLDVYTERALWSGGSHPLYYVRFYQEQFGAFWSLFPAAMVVAIASKPRPALFCACVFGTCFVLQSFGGTQAERFLFYAMPFFVVLWGIGAASAGYWLSTAIGRLLEPLSSRTTVRSAAAASILAGIVGFLVLSTPATELTVRMVLDEPVRIAGGGSPRYWSTYDTTWSRAVEPLQDIVADSDIFLTSQGLHAIYFLGDYDVELNATQFQDRGADDSNIDLRTGRRVIADLDSLRAIVECNRTGVVVIHRAGWRNPVVVNDAIATFIEERMNRIESLDEWGLRTYVWERGSSYPPRQCDP